MVLWIFACADVEPWSNQPGDPAPKTFEPGATPSGTDNAGMGVGLYAVILLGGLLAFGAYKYMQASQESQ